ncbi:MAG: acyl carrier protein [Rhodospirillales bacterium]|nr:acyl carrier protein [Rhodospirillales bacterium]MCB9973945.1 acyl carrier protein [Rhodospirillales bacterium]
MSDKLIALFADILEISEDMLNDETSPKNTWQWDSLTAMHLIAAIETTFDVRLSTKEIVSMDSIAKVRAVLQGKNIDI